VRAEPWPAKCTPRRTSRWRRPRRADPRRLDDLAALLPAGWELDDGSTSSTSPWLCPCGDTTEPNAAHSWPSAMGTAAGGPQCRREARVRPPRSAQSSPHSAAAAGWRSSSELVLAALDYARCTKGGPVRLQTIAAVLGPPSPGHVPDLSPRRCPRRPLEEVMAGACRSARSGTRCALTVGLPDSSAVVPPGRRRGWPQRAGGRCFPSLLYTGLPARRRPPAGARPLAHSCVTSAGERSHRATARRDS
jgi:hypothetical protein